MPTALAPRPSTHTQRALRALANELLEEHHVEYIDDGALTLMPPAGFTHAGIVEAITKLFHRAPYIGLTQVEWDLRTENFPFDLVDDPQKFFIPDLAIAYPGSTSNREFRENLAMVVEVTSPETPKTVANDHGVKPQQYARGGVPCYLLVDQQQASWTVYVLDGELPVYEEHSSGDYGTPIELPEPFGFTIPTDEWPAYRKES